MSKKSRGSLKSEDEWAIRDNFVYLHKELEPASICLHLFEAGVFDKDDLEDIRSCKTRKTKAEKLIEKLLHAGPDEAYGVFLEALEKEQKPIVQRLKLSALERAAYERCPSPEIIPCDLPEDERLREEVKVLKKQNENFWKEKVNLERKVAILEEENAILLKKLNDQRWIQQNSSSTFYNSSKVLMSLNYSETDNGRLYRNMLEMLTNIDESIEKVLTCMPVDATDPRWQEFFNFLAYTNLSKSLKVLLDKGMDANRPAQLSRTIVLYKPTTSVAADTLRIEGVMTPLMAASANGSYRTLQLLLDAGAEVNARDEFGDTALIHLCRGIDMENPIHRDSYHLPYGPNICIEKLLDKDVDIDVQGRAGMTAVMHCVKNGSKHFVSCLVEKNHANLNFKCHQGRTALLYMAYCHWREVDIIYELYNASDKDAKDEDGNTLLLLSIYTLNHKIFLQLLDTDMDVSVQNNDGLSPLMLAINLNLDNFITPLLPLAGGSINLQDNDGNTALLLASQKKMTTLALALLELNGIDVNIQNKDGETVLMVAAKNFDLDLVKAVSFAGANLNLKDAKGRTAMKHVRKSSSAIIFDRLNVIEFLQKEGAIE